MSDLYQRDARAIAAVQRLRFFPIVATGGGGSWLVDEGGRRLLDLSASWASAPLGYGHPAVASAVGEALASTAGSCGLSVSNLPAVRLAEELLATLPEPLASQGSVYLGHAGSDANSAVIRAARRASGRSTVLSFGHSYHGGIGEAQSASGFSAQPNARGDTDYAFVPYPTDTASATEVLSTVKAVLAGGRVALAIVEPILSDGGVHVPPEGFLADLAALCSAAGTLLALDEVKAGLGRTGTLHAFMPERLTPDVIVLGKGLGGCLPLSAAIAPRDVFDAAPGSLLLTTAANPICASAGRAVLSTVIGEQLSDNARQVGERLRLGLSELCDQYAVIRDVRGRGLMLGVEIDESEAPLGAAVFTAMLVYRCWELGAVMFPVGPTSSVVELTPPLILTPGEADFAVDLIRRGLDDVLAGVVSAATISAYRGW